MALYHSMLLLAAIAAGLKYPSAQADTTQSYSLGLWNSVPHSAAGVKESKIVGGKPVSISLYPYMASVLRWDGKKYAQQCGGTILNSNHILSACHCFKERNATLYQVRVGSDSATSAGQVANGAQIFVHPKYKDNGSFDYDACVLKLKMPIQLNRKVKAVSLVPQSTSIEEGTALALIGWGYTDAMHINPLPNKLQQVQLSAINNEDCQSNLNSVNTKVTARMFCGQDPDGAEKDSCQGDSGGPVLNKRTGKQLGVISWGVGCAQLGSPAVYVNLANSEIRSFIDIAMKK